MSSGSIQDPKPSEEGEVSSSSQKEIAEPSKKEEQANPTDSANSTAVKSSNSIVSTPEKPAKEPKMISLHPDELIKWDKKLKDLSGQVKALTAENTALKSEIATHGKRMDERRILDRQGLQQTINELQKILGDTTNNLAKAEKERDKLRDEVAIERENKVSREKEIETLRDVSSEYFLLKQEVNRLEGEVGQLRKGKESIKKVEQANAHLQERVVQLEQQLKQTRQTLQKLQNASVAVKLQKNRLIQEAEQSQQRYQRQKQQKDQLQQKVDMLEMEVRDFQKEKQLAAKRFSSEMKELRDTLSKQLKVKAKLQQQLDILKKQAQQRSDKYAGKSQRFLAQKVQQLQFQNTALKQSTERVSNQISQLLVRLKQKDTSIVILTRQLVKTWPNLQDSEGQQYVQREIIEIGRKQKQNHEQIIQKVMIENLRLKHSIQTIGSEYNEQLRKKKE